MWVPSEVRRKDLDALVNAGLLCPFIEEGQEWLLPEVMADRPAPSPGYIVSFVPFHEHDMGSPRGDFFRGLLFAYEWSYTTSTPKACSRSPRSWRYAKVT